MGFAHLDVPTFALNATLPGLGVRLPERHQEAKSLMNHGHGVIADKERGDMNGNRDEGVGFSAHAQAYSGPVPEMVDDGLSTSSTGDLWRQRASARREGLTSSYLHSYYLQQAGTSLFTRERPLHLPMGLASQIP